MKTILDLHPDKISVEDRGSPLGPCWVWIGPCIDGYGRVKFLGKWSQASLVSLFLDDRPGQSAIHYCDVRPCVRNTHLKSGTRADNMRHARERRPRRPTVWEIIEDHLCVDCIFDAERQKVHAAR